jgi:hypothetical protein
MPITSSVLNYIYLKVVVGLDNYVTEEGAATRKSII